MLRMSSLTVTVCAVLCLGASSEDKLPVLKELPSEVLFRASANSELVLECVTVNKDEGVKYSWLKDGQQFTPANAVQRQNEGTLVIKNPDKSLEGQYQCLAQTTLGTARSRPVNVKMTYIDVPKVTIKKHKPIEGGMYKLDCKIPNSHPKPIISWLYQSVSDPSISRTLLNKRITLSPEGDLYFSNVTKEDTDLEYKYVCTAKSAAVDDYVVLAEHLLEDVVSGETSNGELVAQYLSSDMTAKVGDVTMIYCIYGGTPLAHPDWYKEGKNVNNEPQDRITRYNRSAGKRLLIKDTWLTDAGEYECIVNNDVGKIQKHSIKLSVVSAPQFVQQIPSITKVKRGDDVTIPCEVAGVPSPQVSWSYNTKDIKVESKAPSSNVTLSELSLHDVKPENTGYYGCKGSNENGVVYAETLLYVQ